LRGSVVQHNKVSADIQNQTLHNYGLRKGAKR
jgi:hypothetical protein